MRIGTKSGTVPHRMNPAPMNRQPMMIDRRRLTVSATMPSGDLEHEGRYLERGPHQDELECVEVRDLDAVQRAGREDQHVAVELGRLEPQVDGIGATRARTAHATRSSAASTRSAVSIGSRPRASGMRTWFDPATGRNPASVSARVTASRW